MRTTIPERLRPYLRDLVATGLFGLNEHDAVIRCIERELQKAVKDGFVPPRVNGKVRRWVKL